MDPAQDPATAGATDEDADRNAEANREPTGFRHQVAAVRNAIRRLFVAHVDLARAEAGEIGAEIGRVAILAGVAFGALFVLGLLLPIGLLLFLAEWLLGSIGWGVLLGSLALLDLALMAVLVAVGISGGRVGRDLLVAFLTAAVVTILLLLAHVGGHVAVGIGLVVLLVAWPTLAGLGIARQGIDMDALKARFYPVQTIETTKETIEWVRERTPLGRKS